MGKSTTVLVTAVALIQTSVSINVSPTSGTVPFTVSISGRLTDSAGTGLNNKTINLYCNTILVGSTLTSSGGGVGGIPDGNYTFNLNITEAGTYKFETEFPGDSVYEGCAVRDGTLGDGEVAPPISPLKIGLVLVALIGGGAGAYYLTKGRKR